MRITTLILLALICITASGHAADKKNVSSLPQDVVKFKERRDLCDHFRGEYAYDEERTKFLAESMKKNCTGTDRELAFLRKKYRDNTAVLKALAGYEEKIEGGR